MFWYLVAILAVGLFYMKFVKPHRYWKERGVKSTTPILIFGDNWKTTLQTESFADLVQRVYSAFPTERFSGMYQMLKPTLVIRDPELLKQMAVKDFDHFTDHVPFIPEDYEPLWTKNLFSLTGDAWREMRATLSPAFTSAKMKAMFVLMSQCAEQFADHFAEKQEDNQTVELKDAFTRYANDVIATCAFGIKCDSLAERNNEFYEMGKDASNFSGFRKIVKFLIFLTLPNVAKWLGLTLFSKKVSKFFVSLVSQTVQAREEQNIVRPDMINLLMEARKGGLVHEEHDFKGTGFATVEESDIGKSAKTGKRDITLEDMTAQALVFFFAGFDSVSTLMCFMGYELGINPDIQEGLRNEIDDTLKECNGKLTYDALNNMKYLDMIIAESLRKWPPAVGVDRRCVLPYTIESQRPDEPTLTLNKDDAFWIPIWGLHHDSQYYPEPERFDPERFSDENKNNIKPYTYLPFGIGPRNCIASRFALLETKIVYFHLLSKFEIVVIDKTEVPVQLGQNGFNVSAKNGFWFGLKRRSK